MPGHVVFDCKEKWLVHIVGAKSPYLPNLVSAPFKPWDQHIFGHHIGGSYLLAEMLNCLCTVS